MYTRTEAEGKLESPVLADVEDFPGLCRVCGGVVPRAGDHASCTPSICSERCLAQVIVEYWARFGLEARVNLRDGFARLEGVRGILPPSENPQDGPQPASPSLIP